MSIIELFHVLAKASRISSTEDYIHSRILVGKFKENETSLEIFLIYTMMALLRNKEGVLLINLSHIKGTKYDLTRAKLKIVKKLD